jgi:hypothetical protein
LEISRYPPGFRNLREPEFPLPWVADEPVDNNLNLYQDDIWAADQKPLAFVENIMRKKGDP